MGKVETTLLRSGSPSRAAPRMEALGIVLRSSVLLVACMTAVCFLLLPRPCRAAESLNREGFLWSPYLEWSLENSDVGDRPFDIEATVTFTHSSSGETRTTGMFYAGDKTWRFRFSATRSGVWTFVSRSATSALDDKRGTVTIAPSVARPVEAKEPTESRPHGFITSVDGNRWAWQVGEAGEVEPFVPQIVMARTLSAYSEPEKIDADLQTWFVDHGFNGLHVGVECRWFDFESVSSDRIPSPDPDPDPRTFAVLEELITRAHRAGGMVHIWAWGDDGRRMTPTQWGINGKADQRLQRYIAARLGPLPGWTIGYGFDLWEWVDGKQLKTWHDHVHQHLGWPHFLGGRWEKNRLTQATEALDYASYEQHQPDYRKYVEMLDLRPGKPAFAEDRFRVRDPSPYPEKDYDLDRTRRGLWQSTMAGGVANIWGYMIPSADEGGSRPFPNREQIRTYARFFHDRFLEGMTRANDLTDGVALARKSENPSLRVIVFYKEDTDSIRMDLASMSRSSRAIAVDTRKPYEEIDLGLLSAEEHVWRAPRASDWAIAVGR
jgi:hypothetical protein